MEKRKSCTEKLCSFYVSEWHLVTMILPYINKKLDEKANIVTVLEKDIEENVKLLISKLNLKDEEKILEIGWKANQETNYSKVSQKLKSMVKEENSCNIVFVSGTKDYIDFINKNVDKWIYQNVDNLKHNKIKIVNCYEVTEFNNNIREILDSHDKVLNTAGEKYVYEVFDGYPQAKEMC